MSMNWTPSSIEPHQGDEECNHTSGCHQPAEWDILLINDHGQKGLVRACDDHVETFWGYHPDRETAQEDSHAE